MAPKQAAKQAPAKEAAPAAKPKEQPKAAKPEGKQVAKPEGKQAAKPEGKQQQAAKPQGKQQQQPAKPQGKPAEPAKKPAEKEKPKQKAKAKSEISGVYIRGLNLEGLNRDSIVKLFNCGQPSEVRIRRRGRSGVEGAYVLLFFRTPGATKKALEFNGKVVKGNKLSVVQAKAKPTPERKTYCTSVWVGGVPGGSNAQQLTTLFRKAGKVLRVRVYNPRKTAYVYYATTAAAAKAVKMFNNLSLRGEHLRVKLSIRSKERDAQKAIKAGFTVSPRTLARISGGKGGKPAPKAKGKGAKAAAAPAPKAAAKAAAPAPAAKGGKQAPAAPAPAAKGGKGQAQAAPAAAPAPAAKGGKGQAQAAAPAPAPAPKGGKGQQAQAAPAAKAPQAAPAAKAQAAPAPAPKGGKGQQQQKAAAPAPAAKGGKGKGK